MSTDAKESCSRDLSEFDDKNEILAVKYVDFDCEGGKASTRVTAIATSGFTSDEDKLSENEPPTPDVFASDKKIFYTELLELRRQNFSISQKKSSSGQQTPTDQHFGDIDEDDEEDIAPTSIFKSLSVNLPIQTDEC